MERKKRVVINTDFPILKTGLGKNGKWLAEYLYNTDKYEIFYYACGMPWDHPEFQRLPYTVHGTLPNTQQEVQQLQSRGDAFFRACTYALGNIDKVISEFKPDIFITSNDSWAFDFLMDSKWWQNINIIPHVTLDSVPFLPQQIDVLKKNKKVYVWAPFAKKEANRLGFNNTEVLTGIVPDKNLYKIPYYRKADIRKKNNLPENAFIVNMTSRNQIRKMFLHVLEGYSIWKKQNPNIKDTYVLFHSNFSEPGGWDFLRACDNFGINKNELLTTYICKNCKNYEVKPFCGNDLNCSHCQSEKTQINITIQDGVSEEQLNEIYGISDCMVHCADAAGLEISAIEGLYTELPLATNDYASLSWYCEQPFVETIRNSFGVQLGTQFKRAIPNVNDIAKFLNKIYNLSPEQRSKIGKEGRKWAVSQFSPDIVCKQWEQVIDSLPLIDWNFDLTPEVKNPEAQIPQIQDNKEWLKVLYKEILKMDVGDNDSGLTHWLNNLKNGQSRQDIENYFRNVAYQENRKLPQNQIKFEDLLTKNDNKRVLVVLKESIGDLIYSLGILEGIKNQYPNHDIYFGCKPEYFEIFNGCPHVHKCLPWQDFYDSELWAIGQGNQPGPFDVYINLGVSTQRILNYLSNDNIELLK